MLPSTSPANAAVPYAERLRWFRGLKEWLELEPVPRPAVRALVVDERGRVLLMRWVRDFGSTFWITPGGGVEPGESPEEALRRELREEVGLTDPVQGRLVWTTEFVTPEYATTRHRAWLTQRDAGDLVRVRVADVDVPTLVDEGITDHRWWTVEELERSDELFGPPDLPTRVRRVL